MIKKSVVIFLFTLCIGFTIVTTKALAVTHILDNDALSSAPGSNTMDGVWTYKTGSGYNNDYRIKSATSSDMAYSGYVWSFNVKEKNATYSIYINNVAFNNPRTAYQIGIGDVKSKYAYINQNTAPGGWNVLATDQTYHILLAINGALTTKLGSVGADASRIVY